MKGELGKREEAEQFQEVLFLWVNSMKIIYVGGTFDLTHYGHFELFKRIKEKFRNSKLVVAVNPDEFNERYKGFAPILSLEERMRGVRACGYVDRVIVNWAGEDSKPAILRAKATHILHGDDWKGEALMKQMGLTKEFLEKHKIKLIYLPYTKGISSTSLKARIKQQKK